MATKTLAGWPRVGEVPYQALPLLRFFAYKVRAREKMRKGEGEPGDEAILYYPCYSASIVPPTCVYVLQLLDYSGRGHARAMRQCVMTIT